MILEIDNLGMNFEGVARKEGKVYFVPYALIGETVKADIKKDDSKFSICELKEIITPSSKRIQPMCPYFSVCGGCDIQHLNYNDQLNFKKKHIEETIKKIANIDVLVNNVEPSNLSYFYRNKGAFPVGEAIGMFKANSHTILPINQCFLMNDNITKTFKITKQFLADYNIKGYDFKNFKGIVKFLVVRSLNDQTIVCLVATKKIENINELFNRLSNEIENVGLFICYNNQRNQTILSHNFEHIAGIKEISLNEFDLKYSVGIDSFLQVNNEIKNKIYNKILAEVDNSITLDAYAGAGLLSAIMAKTAKKVYSVEIVEEASKSAQKLKNDNNIANMEVINGDCAKVIPELKQNLGKDFIAVLDPARVGCDEKVLEVVRSAKKILYLSCNPISLSKDLKKLSETHHIKYVQPYDMFPQTKHVETLVCLEKIK